MNDANGRPLVSRRMLDALFILQICVNIVFLTWLAAMSFNLAQDVSALNERQNVIVQQQNEIQICAQHDTLLAVRKIGLKLGLPVEDIRPPNVRELHCDALLLGG